MTEAGFGADLGAEKFIDIKCRKAGLKPNAVVIVATVRALKYHGGVEVADLKPENVAALEKGMVNLERHIDNVQRTLRPAAVPWPSTTAPRTPTREIALLIETLAPLGVQGHPGHATLPRAGAVRSRWRRKSCGCASSPATSSSSTRTARRCGTR